MNWEEVRQAAKKHQRVWVWFSGRARPALLSIQRAPEGTEYLWGKMMVRGYYTMEESFAPHEVHANKEACIAARRREVSAQ